MFTKKTTKKTVRANRTGRKPAHVNVSVSAGEPAEDNETPEENDIVSRLAAQFAENADGDARASVFQHDSKLGWARLFDVDADDIPQAFERVSVKYGSGRYQVVLWVDGRIRARHQFSVKVPNDWKAPGAEVAAPSSDGPLAVLVQAMIQEGRENRAAMMQLLQRQQAPVPADPFMGIEKIAAVMTSIAAMTGARQQTDAMDVFSKGVAFATDLAEKVGGGGGGGGDGGIMGVISEFVKSGALVEIMKGAAAANQHPQPMPQQTLPSPTVQPTPPAAGAIPPEAIAMRAQLQFLLDRARADGNVEIYGAMLLEQLPDELLDQIAAMSNEAVLANFEPLVPEIAQFRPWFGRLLDTIRQMDQSDDALPQDAEDAPSDAGKPPSPIQA